MATPAPPLPTVPPQLAAILASLLPAVPPPTGPSKTTIALGTGGAGLMVYVVDRLLADDGQLAANMLSKLSPVLGPIWASYPSLVIMLGIAAWAAMKWRDSQTARAAADIAAAAASADLSSKVGAVAEGLNGLRGEVHELRGALSDHADATDARISAVAADVTRIGHRVDVLERPAVKRRAAR